MYFFYAHKWEYSALIPNSNENPNKCKQMFVQKYFLKVQIPKIQLNWKFLFYVKYQIHV